MPCMQHRQLANGIDVMLLLDSVSWVAQEKTSPEDVITLVERRANIADRAGRVYKTGQRPCRR